MSKKLFYLVSALLKIVKCLEIFITICQDSQELFLSDHFQHFHCFDYHSVLKYCLPSWKMASILSTAMWAIVLAVCAAERERVHEIKERVNVLALSTSEIFSSHTEC